MNFKLLVLAAFLSVNFSYAQVQENDVENEIDEQEMAQEVNKEIAKEEDQSENEIDENEMAKEVNKEIAKDEEKDLDAIEAESHKLKDISKKQDQKSAKLEKKSENLGKKSEKHANKSDKLQDKSEFFEKESDKLADLSKENAEQAKQLAEEVEASPFKPQREESIKQMCLSQIKKKSVLKILDRRSHEEKLSDCIADYKESELKKKVKIKKAYIGKQCTFNPGISIECPEGTYKFEGNNGLVSVNSENRGEKKEVGENTEAKEPTVSSASHK